MAMSQTEAQALAVKTWGKDAIAEARPDGVCFVSRSKYGLCSPYGHGDTFEAAFYGSQFDYTNCALHDATAERPQFKCHYDGSTRNIAGWPAEWSTMGIK